MNDELIKELAEEQLGDDPFYSKPCEEAIKKALKIEREKVASWLDANADISHPDGLDVSDKILKGEYE